MTRTAAFCSLFGNGSIYFTTSETGISTLTWDRTSDFSSVQGDKTAHALYGNRDGDTAAEFAIELVGVSTLVIGNLVA